MAKRLFTSTWVLGIVFLFLSSSVFGATIFSENMGSGSGTVAIASNTFQNSGTLSYQGDADTRSTTPSTGYTGASGTRCVFITNANNRYFQIDDISTIGYSGFAITYGMQKSSSTGTGTDLAVEYSTNGTTWTALTVPATTTAASWRLVTISSAGLPASSTLSIRFRNTGTTNQFRLDDVILTGTASATTPEINVRQGITDIAVGGSYSFGSQTNNTASGSVVFTIQNTGGAALALSGTPNKIAKSGTNASEFAITQTSVGSSLAAGDSVKYSVIFTPTASGTRTATISIANDDSDENPYTYTLTGTGVAPCAAPANQATSLVLTPAASTVSGSFTAASGGATAYLVVVSTSNTLGTTPTTGVIYSNGVAFGSGTVVDGASGTTFTASSLTPSTPYYFYVFAYNNTSCSGGPLYKSPALTGTATTLTAPITVATYTFLNSNGNETTLPADAPQPTGVNASVMSRGSGIFAAVGSGAMSSNNYNVNSTFNTSNNEYFEFTVTPTAGFILTLTDFSFYEQASGSGPASYKVRSSKDGYVTDLLAGSTNSSTHSTTLGAVFSNQSSGVTFRIYGYDASNTGGSWRIDDVIVKGFINASGPALVVNPTSLAFGNQNTNSTSTQQSFTVTGFNLTNNVVLSVPTGYAFSTSTGGPYGTSNITLTAAQATAGVLVYVVFKPTATGATPGNITMTSTGVTTPPSVALTGTGVVPPPTITTSVSSLTSFGNVDVNTTSAEQSYDVSAVALTANLLINVPTGFAMSTTSGGPYSNSQISLTPSSGTVASTTIYVVYKPVANGAQSGNITNASTGATTKNVAVSGTGVTQCVAPQNQATNLTFPSIVGTTINGSFTAAVGGADGYLVLRSTSNTISTGPVDGTSYTNGTVLGGGTVISNTSATTFTSSGAPVTQYYFFVYAFNNTGCVNGPKYKKPYITASATTLTALYTAFDNFDRANGSAVGNPSSGGSAWVENEYSATRATIFGSKLVLNSGSPAGADWVTYDMTGKYATTFNNAQADLVWFFNMASSRSNPSGFLSTSNTYGSAMILGGTDADFSEGGNGYAVILGESSTDYVTIVRYTGGLMNPNNNSNLTDIARYSASSDQELLNIKVEYSPTTKIWKLYVNEPGGTAPYNTSGTQPAFTFPDPTAATYGAPAVSAADNNSLLNGALPYSGFLWNHATVTDEYVTFDNFNIPTAQACTNNTWTGTVSTNWFTPGNWSCGVVPVATDDVVITNVVSTNFPVINASLSTTATVHDLTINAGASVTVTANVIAGFPVSTNDLEIYGNLVNNGSANWGTGTVTFRGTGAQTISGNNNFQYLTVNNAAGVSLSSGTQKVYGTLALKAGNIATNGRLTIGSNATYTGLVDEFSAGYTGGITGNLTVERYANNTASSFFYIGAPVGGAAVTGWSNNFSLATMNGATNGSQVIPTSTCSPTALAPGSPYGGLFDYRENTVNTCNLDGWHVRTTGAILPAQGFIGRVPVGTVIDLTGTFVTGQTVTSPTLTKSVNASGRPAGMNLVSNPFAAPIDWQAVANANVGKVMGTAYFYQTSGPLAGTYVPQNNTLGGNQIGSSQAFIVEAVSNGQTMSFTDNMKRNGANQYLRTGAAYDQLLTLDVTGNGYADRAYVAFGSDFTTAFDSEFDARKLMSKPEQPSMYVNDGSLLYSIYAQPSIAQVQLVPVDFVAGTNGTYTIAADLNAFDPTAMVFLEDRKLGTMTDLRTAGTYSFAATTGDAAERFVLHFYPGMLVVAEDATCAGVDGNISFNQPGATEWDLQLVDLDGNVVYTNSNFNGNFTVSNLLPSVYTLTLVHASGYTVSKLYMVNGPAAIAVSFAAPATATEGDDVTFTSTVANASTYSWNFGDGNTSTDANPIHSFAYAGQYMVELLVSNGTCQESFTQLVTVGEKLASGIDNVLDGKVSIYAYGTDINIILSNLENISTVDVFDLTGRKVIATTQLQFVNGAFVINMENAANGYYFVRLSNEQDIKTQKVFVNSGK